jgi:hypothetical protein
MLLYWANGVTTDIWSPPGASLTRKEEVNGLSPTPSVHHSRGSFSGNIVWFWMWTQHCGKAGTGGKESRFICLPVPHRRLLNIWELHTQSIRTYLSNLRMFVFKSWVWVYPGPRMGLLYPGINLKGGIFQGSLDSISELSLSCLSQPHLNFSPGPACI